MELPVLAPQGRSSIPEPVKQRTAAERSVSTRCPSDIGGSVLRGAGPGGFSDDDFPIEFSSECAAVDELLEDCGEEVQASSSGASSPQPVSDCEADIRGGFNVYNENVDNLKLNFDEDTPDVSADPMFVDFMEADDEEIGRIPDRMKLRRSSFKVEIEKCSSVDSLVPVPPAAAKGAGFKHIHRRRVETPDKELLADMCSDEVGSLKASEGMAGAAGQALLRWRRSGRASPV